MTKDKDLYERAADIFMRLQDDPSDPAALRDQHAFLQQGDHAKAAFDKVRKAWATSGARKSSPGTGILVALAVFGLGAFFAFEPLRIAMLADLSSDRAPAISKLASGDRVTLDAGSALEDDTDDTIRRVTLLEGASFFEVTPQAKPFVVDVGSLEVHVLGTSFETTYLRGGASVAVFEGAVDVQQGNRAWQLSAGDSLYFSRQTGVVITEIGSKNVALWREDRLVVNGMRFQDLLSIIDRRMPGETLVLNSVLAETRITGGFDLNDPMTALDALTQSLEAQVISGGILGRVVMRK